MAQSASSTVKNVAIAGAVVAVVVVVWRAKNWLASKLGFLDNVATVAASALEFATNVAGGAWEAFKKPFVGSPWSPTAGYIDGSQLPRWQAAQPPEPSMQHVLGAISTWAAVAAISGANINELMDRVNADAYAQAAKGKWKPDSMRDMLAAVNRRFDDSKMTTEQRSSAKMNASYAMDRFTYYATGHTAGVTDHRT